MQVVGQRWLQNTVNFDDYALGAPTIGAAPYSARDSQQPASARAASSDDAVTIGAAAYSGAARSKQQRPSQQPVLALKKQKAGSKAKSKRETKKKEKKPVPVGGLMVGGAESTWSSGVVFSDLVCCSRADVERPGEQVRFS